ncbi:hypothetical protein N8Z32_00035 [Ascidiaceihabitans sp.]|nr:hypothetical protein [Ascidiaceihabitans sp.]
MNAIAGAFARLRASFGGAKLQALGGDACPAQLAANRSHQMGSKNALNNELSK